MILAGVLAVALHGHAAGEEDGEAAVRRALEPLRPLVEETAQLMYTIGACERYIAPSTVEFYIREYMAMPVKGEGLEAAWEKATQEIHGRLYLEGRKDAPSLDFDRTQCQRAIDAQVANVKRAVSDFEAKAKRAPTR